MGGVGGGGVVLGGDYGSGLFPRTYGWAVCS